MTHILLYTTPFCGFCLAAKRLLTKKGLDFEEIDVSFDDALRAEMTARAGGAQTVPQIFVQDRHLGGYVELEVLARTGELEVWLARETPDAEPAKP